jgi:hypothetical protein
MQIKNEKNRIGLIKYIDLCYLFMVLTMDFCIQDFLLAPFVKLIDVSTPWLHNGL